MKPTLALVLCMLLVAFSARPQYRIEVLDCNTFKLGEGVVLNKTSFRGLSVVDDNTIWVSGSRGTIAKSIDGGNTFVFNQLKGYEKSDFRDIEAFDKNTAIIMSSGTPALILKTIDGGQTWKEVFRKNDTVYFLDAMDFWDEKRGMLVGDPINKHFVLLQTQNGGETWEELDTTQTPAAMDGEAVFAASGTSLRCIGKYGKVGFVTGGKVSRIIGNNIDRKYQRWEALKLPIAQGENTQGAFSFATNDSANIIVGGDYVAESVSINNSAIQYLPALKSAEIFSFHKNDVNGYRSCIDAISPESFIACGTSGVDVYKKRNWNTISKVGFHVVRKAKKGKAVFLAGPNGKIGKFIY
jgi:photosystem II stability/assembly factor-like uncharacterized protein